MKESFDNKYQVRTIIQFGENQSKGTGTKINASVKSRALDDHYWTVKSFEEKTGKFHLVRGDLIHSDCVEEVLDQFSLPIPPERIVGTNIGFNRSPSIRKEVLLRSKGICELCGQKGFNMDNGSVYLKTHHIFPLAQGGPDEVWNVVAVCANDHRRLHFSKERTLMRSILIDKLVALIPKSKSALNKLNTTIH